MWNPILECGRTLLDPGGLFTSPMYNTSMSGSAHGDRCEWRIVATHGETIVLNITDFDVPFSDGCKYDYLEIRDGYWHKSPLLARYCGPDLKFESSIISTGPRMLLTYITTHNSVGHRGFAATYEGLFIS